MTQNSHLCRNTWILQFTSRWITILLSFQSFLSSRLCTQKTTDQRARSLETLSQTTKKNTLHTKKPDQRAISLETLSQTTTKNTQPHHVGRREKNTSIGFCELLASRSAAQPSTLWKADEAIQLRFEAGQSITQPLEPSFAILAIICNQSLNLPRNTHEHWHVTSLRPF